MPLRPWIKNGKKIIDSQGRPALCGRCPCGGVSTCEGAVDAEAARLLALVDEDTQRHVWMLQNTFTMDYQCASWLYDEENDTWTLVNPASGNLLIALYRGSNVADTAETSASLLTYAVTLSNLQTGKRRVVGCECRVSGHECMPRAVVLDDYDIAGSLAVWAPDEGDEYTPADSCRVDTCDLLKFKLQTAQYWHGGTMLGEGYYDWLLSPQQWEPANYRYQPFLQAVKWQLSATVYSITYINCDCTYISTHNLAEGETCLEYAGICTLEDPCIALMLLHNRAEQNGWLWHGEGVLVHLAKVTVNGVTTYGDWYALREQSWSGGGYGESMAYSRGMCCAETATGYWVMSCGCDTPAFYTKDDPVEAYWLYLDLEGVCACQWDNGRYPDRELILAYPDLFGIDDVVWGNDNKFEYTYDTTAYNQDDTTYTSHHAGCNTCGYHYEPISGYGGRTMYIDYRALCFTGRAFWRDGSVKTWVRVVYPYGSRGAPSSYNIRQYFAPPGNAFGLGNGIFDTAEFTGTVFTPFTRDAEIYSATDGTVNSTGVIFSGWNYAWNHDQWSTFAQVNGCQPVEELSPYTDSGDEELVREEAGCDATTSPCIDITTTSSVNFEFSAVLSPNTTMTVHPCSVRSVRHLETGPEGDIMDIWYEWFYTRKWITIGANVGTRQTQYGQVCGWLMLNICYVETNLGFIVKGEQGYFETYVLPGAVNAPEAVACWPADWKEPEYDPASGTWYDPHHWLDQTITCTADEDMHFCIEGFEVPADADDEEGEGEQ